MSDGGDIPPDSRWMTYDEAGQLLGRQPDSIRRQAQRAKWPRQSGNDGRARVAIPRSLLNGGATDAGDVSEGGDTRQKIPSTSVGDTAPDMSGLLLGMLTAAVDRADQAEVRAAALEADLAAERTRTAEARERAARLEGELEGLKLGTEHQHVELAQMRREVAEAHNRAVVAEQDVIEATERREGAEEALARARSWNFLNFLFGREGKGRKP